MKNHEGKLMKMIFTTAEQHAAVIILLHEINDNFILNTHCINGIWCVWVCGN